MKKKTIVIGGGIAGLSASSFLAKSGFDVTLLEKNSHLGGRARKFSDSGFTFDMGPSWYWMPDVFENFYNKFNHTTSDFYNLKRLDPSYRVYWKDNTHTDVPADMKALEEWFELNERGSAIKLRAFLKDAEIKYQVGMQDLVYKPSMSLFEFANKKVLKGLLSMNLFS